MATTSDIMDARKKRKLDYSENSSDGYSSDDNKVKPDPERMEKSLTNLQINMRQIAEKMEDMTKAFESFSDGFKANHFALVQDMKEVKRMAIDVEKCFQGYK